AAGATHKLTFRCVGTGRRNRTDAIVVRSGRIRLPTLAVGRPNHSGCSRMWSTPCFSASRAAPETLTVGGRAHGRPSPLTWPKRGYRLFRAGLAPPAWPNHRRPIWGSSRFEFEASEP